MQHHQIEGELVLQNHPRDHREVVVEEVGYHNLGKNKI
jgi:hypothetical protein